MIINEIFKEDEIKNIRERIKHMPVEGCIEKYTKYTMINLDKLDGIEKDYVKKLREDIGDAYAEYYNITYIATLSKEAMLEKTLQMVKEGFSGTNYTEEECIAEDWAYFNDADCHNFIKNRMITILDKVVEEAIKTKQQKRIDELKKDIVTYTKCIKQSKDSILDYEAKLMYAKDQLKDLGIELD